MAFCKHSESMAVQRQSFLRRHKFIVALLLYGLVLLMVGVLREYRPLLHRRPHRNSLLSLLLLLLSSKVSLLTRSDSLATELSRSPPPPFLVPASSSSSLPLRRECLFRFVFIFISTSSFSHLTWKCLLDPRRQAPEPASDCGGASFPGHPRPPGHSCCVPLARSLLRIAEDLTSLVARNSSVGSRVGEDRLRQRPVAVHQGVLA